MLHFGYGVRVRVVSLDPDGKPAIALATMMGENEYGITVMTEDFGVQHICFVPWARIGGLWREMPKEAGDGGPDAEAV